MIENSYCESCKEGTIHYTENDRQICSRCNRCSKEVDYDSLEKHGI